MSLEELHNPREHARYIRDDVRDAVVRECVWVLHLKLVSDGEMSEGLKP